MDVSGYTLIEPPKHRRDWTTSRLVVLPSGPVPLLEVLAREKFGTYDRRDYVAYWKDKNYQHETLENVGLIERGLLRRLPNPYGPKRDQATYGRRWRAAHPLRQLTTMCRANVRRFKKLGILRSLLDIAADENAALAARVTQLTRPAPPAG